MKTSGRLARNDDFTPALNCFIVALSCFSAASICFLIPCSEIQTASAVKTAARQVPMAEASVQIDVCTTVGCAGCAAAAAGAAHAAIARSSFHTKRHLPFTATWISAAADENAQHPSLDAGGLTTATAEMPARPAGLPDPTAGSAVPPAAPRPCGGG